MNSAFLAIARELVRIAPFVFRDGRFALKGGTAINLFLRDMPRLSVDLDLVLVDGTLARDAALADIATGLRGARDALRAARYDVRSTSPDASATTIVVRRGNVAVKVEVNQIIRGTLHPVRHADLAPRAQDVLGANVVLPLLASEEIYAGKLVAALDRQHPRDLFDVHQLFLHEGITPAIRRAFIAYLAFHNRPLHEVLFAPEKPIEREYAEQFAGMCAEDLPLAALLSVRSRLLRELPRSLDADERAFLHSLARAEPDYARLGFPNLGDLPAMRWKLDNLRKLRERNAAKFHEQVEALERGWERIA